MSTVTPLELLRTSLTPHNNFKPLFNQKDWLEILHNLLNDKYDNLRATRELKLAIIFHFAIRPTAKQTWDFCLALPDYFDNKSEVDYIFELPRFYSEPE